MAEMKHAGLKELAYTEIKERLMTNRIQPGERIREDKIAEEIGVSRTPVREAINQLIAENFVVNEPRKGLFAAEISNEEIERMIDVRTVLETLAVRQCCGNIQPEQIEVLEDLLERYKTALRAADYSESSMLDSQMHKYIAEVAQNKKLSYYINDLQDFFTYARVRNVRWTQKLVNSSIRRHEELLGAIRARDPEAAALMMESDVLGMRDLNEQRESLPGEGRSNTSDFN